VENVRHVFIINPAAGKSDRSEELSQTITALAEKHGLEHEILITERPHHAGELASAQCAEHSDRRVRLYACGGDGTLNEVVSGAVKHANAEVTSYPSGSGNDFLKLFGAGEAAFADMERLITGAAREIDFIESEYGAAVNILSVGLDARVAGGMRRYKRLPLVNGHAAYMMSAVEHIIRGMHRPYNVEIDGADHSGKYCMIVAANGQYYGGGFNPVPDADICDGLIDVLLVKAMSRLSAAKVLNVYKYGGYKELPQHIEYMRARELTVCSESSMVINLDGEILRAGRISMRIAEKKLRFIVPRGI
jgi:YegS/Rv2252/BmrU family lipid kinase